MNQFPLWNYFLSLIQSLWVYVFLIAHTPVHLGLIFGALIAFHDAGISIPVDPSLLPRIYLWIVNECRRSFVVFLGYLEKSFSMWEKKRSSFWKTPYLLIICERTSFLRNLTLAFRMGAIQGKLCLFILEWACQPWVLLSILRSES